ncbi:MAG: cell division ATP-binding protein FtsE [Firmicutes bacterium]|nr:cell division ATP-binding protein FtsE [Bacillota bacterium]
MKFIDIKNCYKVYKNGVTAIANLTLSIDKGEFVFITGESGCGKSTLVKMLYREEKPTKGQVTVGGINVAKLYNSKVYKLRRKLGIVFQDFKLLPKLTVYENVSFGLDNIGMSGPEIRKRVMKALDRVGLKEKIRCFPNELSGGEQQRVCIARAIVNEPKVLICDEPTGNLDPKTSKEIVKVINSINKEMGATVLMVTHDKDIVNSMKKRVITLEKGVLKNDTKKGSYTADESN